MLETLRIRNLAVIDSADIPFRPGLNILSGETGAGKSIVVEAISLLLGSRASSSLIRNGCDEAVVEGVFDLAALPGIAGRVAELGLSPVEDGRLLVKRTVHRAGRHRITVNGELATLGNLQALCLGLVDLCSQHEHQSLLRSSTRLELLDRFGKLEEARTSYRESFEKVRKLKLESERLSQDESARLKRLDFLRFQIEELRAAGLSPGEESGLQNEKSLLQSAQGRLQAIARLQELLEQNEDANLLQLLQLAIRRLDELALLDERVMPIRESLERSLAEAEEASLSLARYSRSVDLDPERLEQVLDRLALLADLRRKYGEDASQMIDTLARLEREHHELERSEERLEGLQRELEAESATLRSLAGRLSQGRAKAATRLGAAVTTELRELNMADAEFRIPLVSAGDDLERYSIHGADEIDFVVRTNRGEAHQPIEKIASGGELSRLMLAIRRVISERGGIGVYLFDEIDSGMGGHTAFQVGRKLKSVAGHHQVLCITHLPQVASFGDHHLVVKKSPQGKRTVTEVLELSNRERKEELARMLGGDVLTKKSLENAAELLEMAAG